MTKICHTNKTEGFADTIKKIKIQEANPKIGYAEPLR
jgi:hypothetical protein